METLDDALAEGDGSSAYAGVSARARSSWGFHQILEIPGVIVAAWNWHSGGRSPKEHLVAFIGADDYSLGLETARFLLKTLGGKGNIVIIEGVKGSLTNVDRVRDFNDALKEAPGAKLLASQPGNYQRLQALQVIAPS